MEHETVAGNAAPKRVLVVGAGGFLGGYLVEQALRRGYAVWAGVRKSTSRSRLADPRIRFAEFDFDAPETLAASIRQALPEGRWDYIVYNLGATKVRRYADFNRINHDCLRSFTGALHQAEAVPERLLFISSLSVLGDRFDKTYTPLSETDIPQPNTRYGASKLKAELWLATSGIPHIIFRATGIYGPWDKDYFLMFDSIRKGFDFGVGFRRQMLTFIYAPDLAEAVYMALEKGRTGETYHIAEPHAYSQKDFRNITLRAMHRRFCVPLRLPLWIVKAACTVSEKIGVLRGKPSTLNRDKYRILRQRNWKCDTRKAREDFGFTARTPLEQGVRQSIQWYNAQGWFKRN